MNNKSQPRNTKQKMIILQALRQTNSHPGAEWIYERVRREIPNISLGTVYRNLKLLKESGRVSEFNLSEGINRFDGNTNPHYHIVCDRCGRVFDIEFSLAKGIEDTVRRETGFKVKYHRLELHGLCLDCQKPEAQRGENK